MPYSDLPARASEVETSLAEDEVRTATSSEIEFAVGILASRHYVSPEQAYNCLRIARRRADRENRGLLQSTEPTAAG